MRQIAHAFYALDSQGDGVICSKDLTVAAKFSDRPASSARTISDWMMADSSTISVARFAECMAEEVIDGRALRHAFESLDDDGSEQISAEELFDELRVLDDDLTLEQIIEHVAHAEAEIEEVKRASVMAKTPTSPTSPKDTKNAENEKEVKDHKIDFEEFNRLFPVRIARMKAMEDRHEEQRTSAEEAQKLFEGVCPEVADWMATLDHEKKVIEKYGGHMNGSHDKDKEELEQALKELKKHIHKIGEYLKHPPGPSDARNMATLMAGNSRRKRKVQKSFEERDVFGWDSFMQDQALREYWGSHVQDDLRTLKHAIIKDKAGDTIDTYKAHEAADTVMQKIGEIEAWTKQQMEEYRSIIEVMIDVEPPMPVMAFSSRGLQKHGDEGEDEDGEEDAADDQDDGNIVTRFLGKFR